MKRMLVLSLAACLLLAAGAKDGGNKEQEKLQGAWAIVSSEVDGKKLPVEGVRRVVKGNAYTLLHNGAEAAKGTFQLDPAKSPRAIDVTPAGAEGKPMLGIYKWDGDTQTTCLAPPGKDRPSAFASPEGSGHLLTVWKREKK
jgi:uncharacterized protein (TIGR03067 family)